MDRVQRSGISWKLGVALCVSLAVPDARALDVPARIQEIPAAQQMARPDGSAVSPEDFQRFVDHEVTPRFPAGLTLLGGNGQFRDASGATIKESSKLLILLYSYDRDNSRKIEAIRSAYVNTFQQESVLRVDGSSCVSL